MSRWKASPAARAYTLAASAFVAAAPLAFILINAAVLTRLPAFLRVGRRSEWALYAATLLLTSAVGTACRWRRRALAVEGLRVSEEKAWRVRVGHRVLWTLHLSHEPAQARPQEAWVIRGQLAAVFGLAALSWLGFGLLWRRRVAALEARSAGAGHPVTLARYHRGVAPEQNAYPALRAVFKGRKFDFEVSKQPGMRLGKWDEATAIVERPLLGRQEPFLAGELAPILRRFPDFEPADYRKAASDPREQNFGTFGGVFQAGSLLADRAGLRSFEGDVPLAWEAAGDLERMARLYGKGAELIAKAAAVTLTGKAARACLTIMLNRPGTVIPPDLARRLASAASHDYVREALEVEVAHAFDVYRAPPKLRAEMLREVGLDSSKAAVMAALVKAFHLDSAYLAATVDAIDRLAEPTGWSTLRAELGEAQRERELSPLWQLSWVFPLGSLGNVSLFFAREFESAAWTRLALTFSSLNAYHAAHGRFPESLEALAPGYAPLDVLWDPFGNRPFLYEATENGRAFELASVGPFKTRKDGSGLAMVLKEKL